jgi:uncharacterized coiled-coil protein SlyX
MPAKTPDERLTDLEHFNDKKSMEIDFRLQKQDDTLQEIKNVLIKQTEVLDKQTLIAIDMISLQGRIANIESKQDAF